MEKIKDFFKSKSAGFFVSLTGAALLFVAVIIYSVTFSLSEHINLNFEVSVLLVSLLGVAAFGVMSAFKVTERYAAAALFLCTLTAFMLFNQSSYVYLSAVFFEVTSVEQFFKAFEIMEFGYAFTVVAYLAVWVLSSVGIFMCVNKSDKKWKEKTDEKVTA